jgi:hypothetical protein
LRPQCCTHIRLWNLIDREVLRVNVALELGLKRSTDTTKTIPLDTAEEGVLADLCSSPKATEAVVCVADETVSLLAGNRVSMSEINIPSNEVLSVMAKLLVWREVQVTGPVNNLSVRVMGLLGTEWRPAD